METKSQQQSTDIKLYEIFDAGVIKKFIQVVDKNKSLNFVEQIILEYICIYISDFNIKTADTEEIKYILHLRNDFNMIDLFYYIVEGDHKEHIINEQVKILLKQDIFDFYKTFFINLVNKKIVFVKNNSDDKKNKENVETTGDTGILATSDYFDYSYHLSKYYLDTFISMVISSKIFSILLSKINNAKNKKIIDLELERIELFKKNAANLYLDDGFKMKISSDYNLDIYKVNDLIIAFLKHLVDTKNYHTNYKDLLSHFENYLKKTNNDNRLSNIFVSKNKPIDFEDINLTMLGIESKK